jgi:uncharacterized protein
MHHERRLGRDLMSLSSALLIFLSGVAAGFVNVIAGGGSFLTLPLLMLLGGLPAAAANGTNRIAILVQNLIAIRRFRASGFRDVRQGLGLAVSAVAGSLLGSVLAQDIPEQSFRFVLGGIMVLALLPVLGRPGTPARSGGAGELRHPRLQVPIFFLIGAFGGFIQAGTGYLIIAALSTLGGLSLVRTNSLKLVIIAAYILPSILVFLVNGNVQWMPAMILTGGCSIGGWLGASFALTKGDRWIRYVLLAAVLALAGKLIGLY